MFAPLFVLIWGLVFSFFKFRTSYYSINSASWGDITLPDRIGIDITLDSSHICFGTVVFRTFRYDMSEFSSCFSCDNIQNNDCKLLSVTLFFSCFLRFVGFIFYYFKLIVYVIIANSFLRFNYMFFIFCLEYLKLTLFYVII